jgi:hypothetical protein
MGVVNPTWAQPSQTGFPPQGNIPNQPVNQSPFFPTSSIDESSFTSHIPQQKPMGGPSGYSIPLQPNYGPNGISCLISITSILK